MYIHYRFLYFLKCWCNFWKKISSNSMCHITFNQFLISWLQFLIGWISPENEEFHLCEVNPKTLRMTTKHKKNIPPWNIIRFHFPLLLWILNFEKARNYKVDIITISFDLCARFILLFLFDNNAFHYHFISNRILMWYILLTSVNVCYIVACETYIWIIMMDETIECIKFIYLSFYIHIQLSNESNQEDSTYKSGTLKRDRISIKIISTRYR